MMMLLVPIADAWVLAQDGADRVSREWTLRDSIDLSVLIGLVIVALLVLGVVLIQARRRLLEKDGGAMSAAGSMLDELRRMKARGELSEAEYEAARRAATTRAVGKTDEARPPKLVRPATRAMKTEERGPDSDGGVEAKPGFDLTGAPLPKPDTDKPGE